MTFLGFGRVPAELKALGYDRERMRIQNVRSLKLKGIKFWFRGLSPFDYLDHKGHPIWTTKEEVERPMDAAREKAITHAAFEDPVKARKMMAQMRDAYEPVLIKGTIWPQVVASKPAPGQIEVSDLFVDPEVAAQLFAGIVGVSVQKKNPRTYPFQRQLSWISWRGAMALLRVSTRASGTTITPLMSQSPTLPSGQKTSK